MLQNVCVVQIARPFFSILKWLQVKTCACVIHLGFSHTQEDIFQLSKKVQVMYLSIEKRSKKNFMAQNEKLSSKTIIKYI